MLSSSLLLKRASSKDTYDQVLETYDDQSSSHAFMYKWFQQFENRCVNVSNLPWPVRPLSFINVDTIKDYIQGYPTVK